MTTNHGSAIGALALLCASVIAGSAGCTGAIGTETRVTGGAGNGASAGGPSGNGAGGGAATAGVGGGGVGTPGAPFACTGPSPDPGPTSMLLLSRAQYVNTLQGLFGAAVPNLDSALGADNGYQTSQFGLVQADVSQAELQSYQAAAEMVAAAVVASAPALAGIAPCAGGAVQRTCAQTFVQNFGALAYRAPLTDPAEIARHMALYDVGAMTSHAHGIEMVLRGMLQSPRFLYRVEVGTTDQAGPSAVKLSGFEIAARLSYDLWNTLPDAALTQAAAMGALSTKAGVSAQATRMVQDSKGSAIVRTFLEGLTELAGLPSAVKDSTLFPAWNAAGSTLPASMQGQARAFFDDVLGKQGGTLAALLTSSRVFVNGDMGAYYGVTGGNTFQPLDLAAGKASGLLTLPGFLTLMAKPDQSWPIYRGRFVREALLCDEPPPPPPNVPKPPNVQPGVSTRQRLSQHETDPGCAGCHRLMDPIGFGFENYDAIGRYRTLDGNQPIDASGEVVAATDITGKFDGVAQLASKLAGSAQVEQCVARQWFRFAMSRYEQDPDSCSMKNLVDAFHASGTNLNALPQALVQTDAFLYRRPPGLP